MLHYSVLHRSLLHGSVLYHSCCIIQCCIVEDCIAQGCIAQGCIAQSCIFKCYITQCYIAQWRVTSLSIVALSVASLSDELLSVVLGNTIWVSVASLIFYSSYCSNCVFKVSCESEWDRLVSHCVSTWLSEYLKKLSMVQKKRSLHNLSRKLMRRYNLAKGLKCIIAFG